MFLGGECFGVVFVGLLFWILVCFLVGSVLVLFLLVYCFGFGVFLGGECFGMFCKV